MAMVHGGLRLGEAWRVPASAWASCGSAACGGPHATAPLAQRVLPQVGRRGGASDARLAQQVTPSPERAAR